VTLTAVVVPVPEADDVIGEWRRRYTAGGRRGMPSHVTVVTPWLHPADIDDTALERLEGCAGSAGSFQFELSSLETFPQGVLFLAVEPRQPFVALIRAVCDAFPDYRPYGGEFSPDDVIPHVSVAVADGYPDGPTAADLEIFDQASAAVSASLPIHATARELQIFEEADEGWRVLQSIALSSW
jgi:hypothetical protein